MRKIAPIALVALLTVAFTSCKKDYTCECNYDLGGTPLNQKYDLGKQTKKDAKDACEGHEKNFNANFPGAASVSCSLK